LFFRKRFNGNIWNISMYIWWIRYQSSIDNLIRNISTLSFFCDSESILWKYRDIIYKNEKDENEHFAQYLKTKNINYDEEISLIEKERKNLNK
jgi:hypothetical protein